MRCKGGNDYIEYINNILECQQEEMLTFGSSYELLLFEDVEDMVSAIKEKNNKMSYLFYFSHFVEHQNRIY